MEPCQYECPSCGGNEFDIIYTPAPATLRSDGRIDVPHDMVNEDARLKCVACGQDAKSPAFDMGNGRIFSPCPFCGRSERIGEKTVWKSPCPSDDCPGPKQDHVVLDLFHGRASPEQDMNDWGEQGPNLYIEYVHGTYKECLKVVHDGEMHFMEFVGDCLYYDGVFYGDFRVMPVLLVTDPIQAFEPGKAKYTKKGAGK